MMRSAYIPSSRTYRWAATIPTWWPNRTSCVECGVSVRPDLDTDSEAVCRSCAWELRQVALPQVDDWSMMDGARTDIDMTEWETMTGSAADVIGRFQEGSRNR